MTDDLAAKLASVRIVEPLWIPLSDNCRLSGRMFAPPDFERKPVPAVLELMPYRTRDRSRGKDTQTHSYFAARGYASIRIDIRGAGDSDGVMVDEYTPQEWADAVEAISWIAAQSWCTGSVGIIGLSWSGFNALQIAAQRPPALKAIVTTCASDDRYNDDMHYMGGCLLGDNLQYGATLFTWLGTPPDPLIVGDRWRDMWLTRLEAVYPPAMRWIEHPERDDYWKSGSVCEDYSRIDAAVLAVGGWADGYTNAVMRLLSHLRSPRKGLIGPWGHAYPHFGLPGPQIDFLGYVTRWWDHWLKGVDSGIMDEPELIAWMQESEPPLNSYQKRRGHWVAEPAWPSVNITRRNLLLGHGKLQDTLEQASGPIAITSTSPDLGTDSGEWCPYGCGADMPPDQRLEDGGSAVFDSAPLSEALQILGGPNCRLVVRVDNEESMLAVRLNDVSPDGVSRRITYGLLNLAHRHGHEVAEPMPTDQPVTVVVKLNDVGYEVPAGHHLRLAISSAYWPLAMGLPHRISLIIDGGSMTLPIRLDHSRIEPDLGDAVCAPYPESRILRPPHRGRLAVTRDLQKSVTRLDVERSGGSFRLADVDLTVHSIGTETYSMPWFDPAAATAEARRLVRLERAGWECEVKTVSRLGFEGDFYIFEGHLEAAENQRTIFQREWKKKVRRSCARSSGAVMRDIFKEEKM
ncbi:MAG: CocE/NonD family hydrolase [Mesorhizobium sp.]|uniref:CocE/NonD family hydrolase n=1 Tax=Mesorhizobium sp. TaxID=1871066 RepID=UPI000FE7B6B6|nr:CocE/NonD family hydrolase [Mesorhizobium sp.]RWP40585.1 MAG: CocE/NonD family hydrolase [Mesorhizobium sp.]